MKVSFALDRNLTPDFIPAAHKKHVGSRKVAEVYRAAKCTRLVNLHCRVSKDFQLAVKRWDLISQHKNVFMLVRSVKESYHGNISRGPFCCIVACQSGVISFWGVNDVITLAPRRYCPAYKQFLFSAPRKIGQWRLFSPRGGNLK